MHRSCTHANMEWTCSSAESLCLKELYILICVYIYICVYGLEGSECVALWGASVQGCQTHTKGSLVWSDCHLLYWAIAAPRKSLNPAAVPNASTYIYKTKMDSMKCMPVSLQWASVLQKIQTCVRALQCPFSKCASHRNHIYIVAVMWKIESGHASDGALVAQIPWPIVYKRTLAWQFRDKECRQTIHTCIVRSHLLELDASMHIIMIGAMRRACGRCGSWLQKGSPIASWSSG